MSLALFTARLALGAPNDAAVQKLRDQAIDQDYLATNYTAAEKKLNDALALCQKTADCSPFIRARVHCDLGVVEFMLHKVDLARTEFATALMEDPSVGLDTNLSNTDVQREFAAVKSGGPPPPGSAGSAPPGANAGAGSGAIVHTAPKSQLLRTPLPIYVQVPEDMGIAKVMVRYRPVGARDWKAAVMRPMDRGFGVEIPCVDVGDREGELDYYVQALDGNGDLVAASGRSATPHKVAIVKKVAGEAAHFPNQAPPEACTPGRAAAAEAVTATGSTTMPEASDCPPGFPGCHGEGPTSCESTEDCTAGEACVDRVCQRGEAEIRDYKKNWLSLGIQLEDLVMPGADNACAGGQGYTCFRSDTGAYYADIPAANHDDKVLGGFATSPMVRILVGYDRAVLPHVTVGGRLGYAVFGAGPQRPGGAAFLPIHVEARIAYWFGRNVLARKGVRVFGLLAAGMTEVDASQSIDVFPRGGGSSIPIDAWTKTGLGFGALGAGVMFAITRGSGLVLEAKGVVLFPTVGIAPAGQIAYTVGL